MLILSGREKKAVVQEIHKKRARRVADSYREKEAPYLAFVRSRQRDNADLDLAFFDNLFCFSVAIVKKDGQR